MSSGFLNPTHSISSISFDSYFTPLSKCYLLLGNLYSSAIIYSHALPVHPTVTRGQVCPCVASSNRKYIMDVTPLSPTKSNTLSARIDNTSKSHYFTKKKKKHLKDFWL